MAAPYCFELIFGWVITRRYQSAGASSGQNETAILSLLPEPYWIHKVALSANAPGGVTRKSGSGLTCVQLAGSPPAHACFFTVEVGGSLVDALR